jgi:hypothetical protein
VRDLAELRIRNLLCFSELRSYNDTAKFLFRHPLLVHLSERYALEAKLRKNPEEFLQEY